MHVAVEFLSAAAGGFHDGDVAPHVAPHDIASLRLAALAGRPRPSDLGVLVPRDATDVPQPPPLDPRIVERAELVDALASIARRRIDRERLGDEGRTSRDALPDGTASALARLARPDACVVVCGQQPGFCGGPLLDALKTLHTIRLARELERHFARPVVPVYWNHGDDSDAVEVHGVHLVNANFDVAKVALASFGASRTPLSERPVRSDEHRLAAVRGALEGLLPASAARNAEVVDLLFPRDGETLVAARTRAWFALFGHHGLLVLEPDALRAAHGRALARLVLAHADRALERGAERLRRAGFAPAPEPAEPPALLFRLQPATDDAGSREQDVRDAGLVRRAVRPRGDGRWRLDGEDADAERTAEELAAQITAAPESWTAGALLRPLVQDALLPVAAYVGGPAELAYHARLAELRAAASLPDTPFVPRVHACVTTPALRFAARQLGSSVGELLEGGRTAFLERAPRTDGATNRATTAADADPLAALAAQLASMADRHAAELLALRAALAEHERGLAQRLKRAAAEGKDLVDEIARKLRRVADNRGGKLRRHHRRVGAMLWPLGRPQERVLGLAALLAAGGSDWLDALLEELDPFPTECLVVHLGREADDPAAREVEGWL